MKGRLFLLVSVAALFAACQPEPLRKSIPFDFFSQYEGPVKEVVLYPPAEMGVRLGIRSACRRLGVLDVEGGRNGAYKIYQGIRFDI